MKKDSYMAHTQHSPAFMFPDEEKFNVLNVSLPDLYVTLRLPTASACTLRTRTINNSGTPEWNGTFHFRAFSQAKNILEINLYDEDIMRDDECTGILFDISTLKLGQKETKTFIMDDKMKDKLWVEFEMTESSEAPVQYLTNGVLLAGSLSTVEVKLDKLPTGVRREMLLKLQGAYNEDQVISMSKNISLMQNLRYYINKNLETEIELRMDNGSPVVAPVTLTEPNKTVSLLVGKETVNLHLNTVDSPEEDMKVRLDFDIPAEEKEFLVKRRQVVSCALQKFLNLKTPLDPNKVPTVALVCSGGGSRAMTGMYGSMKGLQSLGLLDTISYITSVSGSTWATACLYSDPHWSNKDLDEMIKSAQKELSKSTASLFSPTQLHYYHSELQNRMKEGHSVSLIDIWGLVIEHLIFGKKHTGTLSEQKKAVSEGQNPLPIYTAINMKKDTSGSVAPVTEWCEFTPYEVGFSKYGAFVPAETFGSEFYLGHVIKKLSETRISFLLGMWSNLISTYLVQLCKYFTGQTPSWFSRLGNKVNSVETNEIDLILDTIRDSPEASVLCSFLTNCPIISTVFNFLRGFSLHNLYRKSPGFSPFKDTDLDAFPNKLTPADSTLHLEDSGLSINTAFSPVLRPHRRADVILSLDYSWVKDHLQTLKETQQYCSDHKLPFPNIDFSKYKSEPTREVYVFEDEKNPDAPIVIHFPLVNISFKEYKAPGIKRRGKKELDEGNIDVSSDSSPYKTWHLTFQPQDFQRLVDLASYNIENNQEIVKNALKKALNKKSLG